MRSQQTARLRLRPLWALLTLVTALVPANQALAAGPEPNAALAAAPALDLLDGTALGPTGLALAASAGPPPAILDAPFQRFGSALSTPITLAQPTTRLRLSYAATVPPGASIRVDVRGSLDGQRWLPWVVGLPDGAVVGFVRPVRLAQYRVSLLGGLGEASPHVRDVRLASTSLDATVQGPAPSPYGIAPTFRVRATRQGMIGGRTANGYVIPPRARFVSLPSWSVLSTRGRDEYQVRISYRGRSSVVPVYDVGPYSGRDDYWDQQRDGFPDLERGWPMDHAAYYEGYNGGRADKGFVRFPTAIDVGDGVWWDELGIVGDQAEVEVTYLWLGQDPTAGPPRRDPAAAEHLVDELGGDFWHSAPSLSPSAVGCGMGRHAYWTPSTTDPAGATVARWQPDIPAEALYDVFVHVPICGGKQPPVAQARYVIQHRDGAVELAIDQRQQTGWVHLGRFPFAAGTQGFVQLGALAGDGGGSVWFDQAKWVRVP